MSTTSGPTTSALPSCLIGPGRQRCRCGLTVCLVGQVCMLFECLAPCSTPPKPATEKCICGNFWKCAKGQVCNTATRLCYTPETFSAPPVRTIDVCACGEEYCSIGEMSDGDKSVTDCPAASAKTSDVCVCGSALCQKDQTCNAVGTECI